MTFLRFGTRGLTRHPLSTPKAFTLVELIVVITILSILSTIGFITMSHQSSTARDGKRIAEIQDLANSTRLKTAQLKKLPLPTSESIALYVDPNGSGASLSGSPSPSASFVGYQGYMTNIIAQSLGYGQDNIKDPLDKTPYTYRVNQLQDKAQFLSYLENSRFQRTLTIAGYTPLIDTAHALEVDTSLFQDRYPYTTGDILGILIDKESNAPMQSSILNNNSNNNNNNNNSNTGSLTLTPDSDTTYTLLLTEETTLSSLSSGSLTLMKDGLLQKKTLESIAGGAGDTNNNSNNNGGNNNSNTNGHILTMGEYSIMGNTYYGYIGPLTIGVYAGLGVNITTITPGSLDSDEVEGETIDAMITTASFSSWYIILVASPSTPDTVAYTSSQGSMSCSRPGNIGTLTEYGCTGTLLPNTVTTGSQHELEITFLAAPPSLPAPDNVTNAPLNTDVISNVVTASNISSPVNISITDGELRINGGSWTTNAQITNNGDQVEYRTSVVQDGERKIVAINFNGNNSQWIVDAYSCFSTTNGNPNTTMIASYSNTCAKDVVIPSVIFGKNVVGIYYNAFSGSQLTSVVIPNSVLYITEGAFANNQLTSVTIPNGVTGIGKSAFANNQLTSVIIGSGVTHIYDYAFMNNQLTSVTLPNGMTNIDYMAFRNNQLTSVTIPGSVVGIGDWAFYNNSLTSLTIGNSVSAIGQSAFANNQLTSLNIPNSVNFIGSEAFSNNQITSIVIPGSVDYIGDSAFRSNLLTSVVIENNIDNLTYIEIYAFNGNALTSITIPNSVGSIGGFAFNDQWNSAGNGTVYGPSAGYVKDRYINDGNNWVFDKIKLPNYVDLP